MGWTWRFMGEQSCGRKAGMIFINGECLSIRIGDGNGSWNNYVNGNVDAHSEMCHERDRITCCRLIKKFRSITDILAMEMEKICSLRTIRYTQNQWYLMMGSCVATIAARCDRDASLQLREYITMGAVLVVCQKWHDHVTEMPGNEIQEQTRWRLIVVERHNWRICRRIPW